MIKRLFTNLTPFIPLMIGIYLHIMERGKSFLWKDWKGLRPFNLPVMNSLGEEG